MSARDRPDSDSMPALRWSGKPVLLGRCATVLLCSLEGHTGGSSKRSSERRAGGEGGGGWIRCGAKLGTGTANLGAALGVAGCGLGLNVRVNMAFLRLVSVSLPRPH